MSEYVTIERHGPGPRKYNGPKRRVNAVVCNGDLCEVFDALCALKGRRPHQLVHDIVREYLVDHAKIPEVREAITLARLKASPLRLVES